MILKKIKNILLISFKIIFNFKIFKIFIKNRIGIKIEIMINI